jgi:hypothetical protein
LQPLAKADEEMQIPDCEKVADLRSINENHFQEVGILAKPHKL